MVRRCGALPCKNPAAATQRASRTQTQCLLSCKANWASRTRSLANLHIMHSKSNWGNESKQAEECPNIPEQYIYRRELEDATTHLHKASKENVHATFRRTYEQGTHARTNQPEGKTSMGTLHSYDSYRYCDQLD